MHVAVRTLWLVRIKNIRRQAMMQSPTGKLAPTSHGTTHYVLVGRGPLIVFSAGAFATLAAWERIIKRVAALGFSCLAYDYYDRGCSTSSTPLKAGRHTIRFDADAYVTQLLDLLRHLRLDTTSLVHVGHGFGAGVGIGYAARHGRYVRGLCIINGVVLPANRPLATHLTQLPVLGGYFAQWYGRRAMIEFVTRGYRNSAHPEVQQRLRDLATRLQEPRVFASCIATTSEFAGLVGSHRPGFAHVASKLIPMRLVWGDTDATCPPDQCLALQRIILEAGGTSTIEWLRDAPHDSFGPDTNNTERVVHIVVNFARECDTFAPKAYEER